ncbi:MAG: hypothetical protein AAFO84_13520 [Cyanobacteria bacterium J06598_1]
MRFLVKFPLLALLTIFAANAVVSVPAFAGSEGVNQSGSGSSGVGDTFSPTGQNAPAAINSGIANILESIRSNQSVPSVNGNTVTVPVGSLEALVGALSYGQGSRDLGVLPVPGANPSSSDTPQSAPQSSGSSGSEAAVDRPGGSIFGLRNSQIDGGSGGNTAERPGGSIFGLRDSGSTDASGEGSESVNRPGGSIFGLRTSENGGINSAESSNESSYSPAAQSAITALEQQILSETGFAVQVDIIPASARNYSAAVSAANEVVLQLNSQQLNAVIASPTFVSILRLLGNVNFDAEGVERVTTGSGFGIPLIRLADS